jgi:catechol-2,3-dioxygenase
VPLRRTQLSHLGLRTPDAGRLAAFYEDAVGLSRHESLPGGGLRLGWGRGHHVLDLLPGEPGLDHFGLEVRDGDELQAVAERAAAAGLGARPLPELPNGFELRDPDGTAVQVHGRVGRDGETAAVPGRRPNRMQHLTLATGRVAEAAAFYTDVLGFSITDWMGESFVWLRCGPEHHTVAAVRGAAPGLDHYAYEIGGWDDFKLWCDRLAELAIPVFWGPGRHGPGNNLFIMFDDPDGTHVELSAELERYADDVAEIQPRVWAESPRTTNLWGGAGPAWRS